MDDFGATPNDKLLILRLKRLHGVQDHEAKRETVRMALDRLRELIRQDRAIRRALEGGRDERGG